MNKNIFVFVILFITPLSGIAIDLYTPSLPAIAGELQISSSLVKMTITTYLFGFACGQLIVGALSDSIGRKKPLLVGMAIFTLSSVFAAFSQDIYTLLTLRALQGIGTATSSVISKSIASDIFKEGDFKKIMSSITIVWGLSPIIAPVIGGYIQYYFNWQANFYFYGLIGLISFLLVFFLLPETLKEEHPLRFKSILNSYKIVATNLYFLSFVILLGIGYSFIVIFNVLGPFLIQDTLGFSSIIYGRMALLIGTAYFIGCITTRQLLKYFDSDAIITFGLLLTSFAAIVGIILSYHFEMTLLTLSLPIFFIIAGIGIQYSNYLVKAISIFPKRAGAASAVMGNAVMLITMGSSILGSFIKSTHQTPIAWFYFIGALLALIICFSSRYLLNVKR